MSQAFMREREEEWLGNVSPDLTALSRYLTRENGGVKVYEVKTSTDENTGRQVHEMSNGERYALDDDRRWYMLM